VNAAVLTGERAVEVLPPRRSGTEVVVGVLAAVYVTLAGAVAGLVWAAVAPKLSKSAVLDLSGAMFHPQVGADAWFLLVGALAGVVCAAVAVYVVGEPGPGLVAGLAVGGLAAAFVADRVGYLAELHGSTQMAIAAFRSLGGEPFTGEFDFRVRALGVVTAWPIASLAVVGLVMAVNAWRRSLP
jgi:hypothetical protein